MNKKIIIIGVIVVVLITIGTFIIIRQTEEVPVANDVVDPAVEEIIAPKIILTGNLSSGFVGVRQGYVATFDIYHKDKLVGTYIWKRIEENKTKSEYLIKIVDELEKRITVTVEHDVDLRVQRIDFNIEEAVIYQTSYIFDYKKNETIITFDNDKVGFIRFRQEPDAFEKINIQTLEVGWKREFPIIEITSIDPIIEANPGSITIEVIDQKTITVPAGTFDILRVEANVEMMEIYMIFYITSEGRLVKFIDPIRNFVYKLRDYSPIAETQSK